MRSTGFGPTSSTWRPSRAAAPAGAGSVFDVCHVGVVLRALLFVHGVLAIGVVFVAPSFAGWLALTAAGSSIALPGVLLWLLVAVRAASARSARCRSARSGSPRSALGAAAAADSRWSPPCWSTPGRRAVGADWLRPGAGRRGARRGDVPVAAAARQGAVPADTTARLAELQSRIRPHFLFNTLNTALALVRLDPARAEGVLEDLAELFRVAITDSAESVTLAEEVELARRYLAIEQIRFGSRLHVSWELDPEAGSARVPPLLLQPLVENAVRHGVEPSAEGGVIRVRTQVKFGRAVVSIANSVPKERRSPGNGMALRNVRERLRLMHDVAAQFETRREADVFRVQIVVPL